MQVVAHPEGCKITGSRVKCQFKNWKPKADIEIFQNIGHLDMILSNAIRAVKGKVSYTADKRLYVDEDIKFEDSYSEERENFEPLLQSVYVLVLRNEIYARHGYQFSNKFLQGYFSESSWYKSNPDFSEKMFNSFEQRNLIFLKQYESEFNSKFHIFYKLTQNTVI